MPGLWGVIGGVPSDDDSALFVAMGNRLKHHDFYRSWVHHQADPVLHIGRLSLGFVNAADQPVFNEDRLLMAMMEGEVYDPLEHRRALEAAGHRFRGESHAELLLHGYEEEGRNFFRKLNGTFAAAIWDHRQGTLILAADRFGMRPLYYIHQSGRLLFAQEIKALLADPEVSRAPNLRGIAQFFTFGQLLGEDTLLEAVAVLPAAGWLVYEPRADRVTLERYWRLEPADPDPVTRREVWLDRLDEAFHRAVERRVADSNRLGLSLSGGLDSRTILAAIDPARTPITTVSLGMEGSIDIRAAERMCALKGCSLHRYQLNGAFLKQFEGHLKWMVQLTDGHYLSQCVATPTLPVYRELNIEVLLRGHAGELMHLDKAYNYSLDREAFAIRDEVGLESWLYSHLRAFLHDQADCALFTPALRKPMEGLARDSLRACLAESRHIEPPVHRIWHLFLTQRLRRETALSMVEFGSQTETRLPFLDNDLIDLLFATPPELKRGDTIQADILRRRMPAFLDIPNANTGARIGAGRLGRSLGRFQLRILAKLGVPGYQPYERLGLWLRRELRSLVDDLLLSDRCLGRGIFNPQTLRAIVRQHLDGGRNHTFLLLTLMIFEQGQRLLIDPEDAQDGRQAEDGRVCILQAKP
jgi:asparagine synthase (glutamine-hydrolysing)